MQPTTTSTTSSRILSLVLFNILVLTGCASTTENIFADTLGISPESDEMVESNPKGEVAIAVNELAVKDTTARASLKREPVVPQEEKKSIAPNSIPKAQKNNQSTSSPDSVPAVKKTTIEKNAPVTLNQLYFDNRDKEYWENVDRESSQVVRLSKASYVASKDSPQVINGISIDATPFSKAENLISRANQSFSAKEVPTFIFPAFFLAFGLIIGIAALGYNLELKRISAAERNELAKKNLWNKGLNELIPPRKVGE